LRRGVDLGMTHIDTAEMYGDAEPVIAEAIAGGARRFSWFRKFCRATHRGAPPSRPCERSLARLKTDRLDCYLLHWRGSYSLDETVAAFDRLVDAGKIRRLGRQQFLIPTISMNCWRLPATAR